MDELEFPFVSKSLYPWLDMEVALELPLPADSVGGVAVTYVKGVGLSLRVVAVPGSDQMRFMHETEFCGGCSTPTPAVWTFTAFDPETLAVAQVITLDIHSALYWIEHPDALFEYTEDGYDAAPMASIGERVALVPPSSVELLLRDCANWLTAEMDEETIAESGLVRTEFGVGDLMSGDDIEDAFRDFLGGRDD